MDPVPPQRWKILPPGSLEGRDWVIPDDFDDPIDDMFEALSDDELEWLTHEEETAFARAREESRRGETVSHERLLRELGG